MISQEQNNKKRVLIIANTDLNNSGAPNVIYQTILALSNDYIFDVILFGDDLYYKRKLSDCGIEINTYNFSQTRPDSKIGKFIWYLSSKHKYNYKKAYELLTKNNYYAIHSFKEEESWPFLKAAKKVGIKKRIVYSNITLHKPSSPPLLLIYKRCKRLTNKYSTIRLGGSSRSCASIFTRAYKVVHTSYNENTFNGSNKYCGDSETLNLTQVANLCPNKNQMFTIDVFSHIARKIQSCNLRLIGKEIEPGYKGKLENRIKELNLDKKLVQIYQSNNVPNDLKQSTFLILPSLSEGAPITVMEAQACGLTCFVSNAVAKEMDCGGCVYIDINDNPLKTSEKIIEIFRNQQNTRHVFDMSEFSFSTFSNKLNNLYKD